MRTVLCTVVYNYMHQNVSSFCLLLGLDCIILVYCFIFEVFRCCVVLHGLLCIVFSRLPSQKIGCKKRRRSDPFHHCNPFHVQWDVEFNESGLVFPQQINLPLI